MRRLLLLPPIACLLVALSAGLLRLGWDVPVPNYDILIAHGALMVCGFLGALICLERAVALNRAWGYVVPALPGLSGIVQIFAPGWDLPRFGYAAGSLGLIALYVTALRIRRDFSGLVQAVGAGAWLAGNLALAARWPLYAVVPWWIAFLVLTVAGERLELSRFVVPEGTGRRAFLGGVLALLLGCGLNAAATLFQRTAPTRSGIEGDFSEGGLLRLSTVAVGAGLLALGAWLLRHDIARRSLHRPGLTRFLGVSLLLGHAWLVVAGLVAVAHPGVIGGPPYDAYLHAVFLGFVFSMIFGHALIILPAVTGIPAAFHRGFYVPLALLHASVAARAVADFQGNFLLRNQSAPATAAAIGAFVLAMALAILFGKRDTTR